jgi:hypothetical protein
MKNFFNRYFKTIFIFVLAFVIFHSVSQSKEDREAKKPKFWTGSGKVFWSDGKPAMAVEKKQAHQSKPEYAEKESGLPF